MGNEKRSERKKHRAEAYAQLIALPFWVRIAMLCLAVLPLYEFYRLLLTGQLHTHGRFGGESALTFRDDPLLFLVWLFLYLVLVVLFGMGGIIALFGKQPNHSSDKEP